MNIYCKKIGSGPNLVLLHGWAFNSGIWDSFVPELQKKYTLHLIDLPGCGFSSAITMPNELSACVDLLLTILPEQAHYVGWSFGGLLARYIAWRFPEKIISLTTICSTPRFIEDDNWHGVSQDFFNKFYQEVRNDLKKTLNQFVLTCLSDKKQQKKYYSEVMDLLYAHGEPDLQSLLNMLDVLQNSDLRFEKINCSSRYLVTKQDVLTLHNDETVIDAIGHIPMITNHDLISELFLTHPI